MPQHDAKKKRFYWIEGVTRREVEKSLNDQRPSLFRQQRPRRTLVVVGAISILGLALNAFVPGVKLASYLEVMMLILITGTYFKLRAAVRHVSDAPDELLDERQITMRNAAYVVAYRWLTFVSLALVLLLIAAEDTKLFGWSFNVDSEDLSRCAIAFLFLAAGLPASVMAWQLPSEVFDDETGDRPDGALN